MIALTHIPSLNMQACERTFVPQAEIDHVLAQRQHAAYRHLLSKCGASVVALDVNLGLPDCTFIEDNAIVLDEVAILTSMGAASRRTESASLEPILREYRNLLRIHLPATIEGGDVLCVGRTLLVGESCRTNRDGITAMRVIARRHGYSITPVPVHGCLHLKTACTALPDGRLLVNRDWIDVAALAGHDLVSVPVQEPWGANVALIGDKVLMSAAHVHTAELIQGLGFNVKSADLSEFAKAEGGVTCLSLLIS
jgi:dimethylargininase